MREDYLNRESEGLNATEKEFEKALRPLSFDDFTGQQKVVDNIKVFVMAQVSRKLSTTSRCLSWQRSSAPNH
jgi:holliday junction DNA helicase RuvB